MVQKGVFFGMCSVKLERTGEAMGKREPYTERGLRRVPCERCGKPSEYQWNVCATGGKYFGMCGECDMLLNKLTLKFFNIKNTEAMLLRYVKRMKMRRCDRKETR